MFVRLIARLSPDPPCQPHQWLSALAVWHTAHLMDVHCLDKVALRFHHALQQADGPRERDEHRMPPAQEIKQSSHVTARKIKQGSSSQIVHQHYIIWRQEAARHGWSMTRPERWIPLTWGVNTFITRGYSEPARFLSAGRNRFILNIFNMTQACMK